MPHTKRVFDALERQAPWFKEAAGKPSSMLYIGWREGSHPWWHRKFCPDIGVTRVGVMEIFGPNFNDLKVFAEKGLLSEVQEYELIHGDVRLIKQFVQPGRFDIIFWDHGPEHVTLDELKATTPLLYDLAGRLVIYCCPWGKWPQGPAGENMTEEHKIDVTPEHLTDLGMNVVKFGEVDQEREGELVGFRFVKEFEGMNK